MPNYFAQRVHQQTTYSIQWNLRNFNDIVTSIIQYLFVSFDVLGMFQLIIQTTCWFRILHFWLNPLSLPKSSNYLGRIGVWAFSREVFVGSITDSREVRVSKIGSTHLWNTPRATFTNRQKQGIPFNSWLGLFKPLLPGQRVDPKHSLNNCMTMISMILRLGSNGGFIVI